MAGLQALNFHRGRLAAEDGLIRVNAAVNLRLFHEAPVDHDAERVRLQKQKEKLEQSLAQVKKQLEDKAFLSRAPREVVRNVEHRHLELTDHYRKVLDSLERLG